MHMTSLIRWNQAQWIGHCNRIDNSPALHAKKTFSQQEQTIIRKQQQQQQQQSHLHQHTPYASKETETTCPVAEELARPTGKQPGLCSKTT
jgi:hypothetical protein